MLNGIVMLEGGGVESMTFNKETVGVGPTHCLAAELEQN